MNLYLLLRLGPTDYDEHVGFVIQAPRARDARRIAAHAARFIDPEVWRSSKHSVIHKIGTGVWGKERLVLSSFKAG